jgi:hypothetical protein
MKLALCLSDQSMQNGSDLVLHCRCSGCLDVVLLPFSWFKDYRIAHFLLAVIRLLNGLQE